MRIMMGISHPQAVDTTVIHEGQETAAALAALGLTESLLLESAEWGLRHAFSCTLHEPPSVPGIIAWGKIVRALRDRLVAAKWQSNNASNYATVISPTGQDAIAVAAGNAATGRASEVVATRTTKGPLTRSRTAKNQLSLFEMVAEQFPSPRALPDEGVRTWLLLHYVDDEAEEIRVELSLPVNMDETGRVTGWQQRIILSPIPHLPEPFSEDAPLAAEDVDDVDIDIRRRA
ncbi:hypothetical protein [Salsipaludibacter albus]|uniref:hypothetical protein n=1 Tax=Salsipaludibacter albus TaxID=2849650 RepID=UPI001EE4A971|nr:hypothetical protein [Salsipaludibacter albus]MBY5161481.1 hypothetical protein [Salsipaludibacter albus]